MNYQLSLRIFLICLIALILTILPIPASLSSFRPPWILLVILYLQFFLPAYFSVTVTIVLGLSLDLLMSTLMGEHIIALVAATWIASTRVRRFHLLSLLQQIAIITGLSFIYELMLYWIDIYQGYNHSMLMVLGTTLLSLMVWPWVSLLLSHFFCRPTSNRSKWA